MSVLYVLRDGRLLANYYMGYYTSEGPVYLQVFFFPNGKVSDVRVANLDDTIQIL